MKEFVLKYIGNKGIKELSIFISFLIFYKISRYIAIGDASTAFKNAHKLIEFEKELGIFTEPIIQSLFLSKISLIKFLNTFYMYVHIPATVVFFVWLFKKHNKKYYWIRNGFIAANCISIIFFITYPCAPPRMLGEYGFTDTLLQISGINLYSGFFSNLFNQYAAVPSMHFGNAFLIAIVVVLYAKKSYKLLVLTYPLFVLLVIVLTANHFYLDAILGGLIVITPYPLMCMISNLAHNKIMIVKRC
ncbi:MAG: hypothetical protein VR77_07315 [Flavobacteriales bacterium BRH_c54]|nr:MAG: hypothetical protein VR77_07315 [Flavobacteriales bacterium BRH_c54]